MRASVPGRPTGATTNTPIPAARRAAYTVAALSTAVAAGVALAGSAPPLPAPPTERIAWVAATTHGHMLDVLTADADRPPAVPSSRPAPTPPSRPAPTPPSRPAAPARASRDHVRSARQPARPTSGWVPPAAAGGVAAVVAYALAQVGHPYGWGAAGPYTFDCSGLAMAAYAHAGVRLPHDADALRGYGRPVARGELAGGDLVLYPGHVGIYVGAGRMVAAANPREGVVVQAIYGTPSGYRRIL